MKKISFLMMAILLLQLNADAKIRRVGFFGSPVSGTDYSTFDLANTAAASGDTIMMFPNTTISATVSKKLFIVGPGNWLDPNATPKGNANLQAFAGIATINSLTLVAGSAGSVVSGFNGGTIYVVDSNITIMRNSQILVYITYSPTNAVVNINNLQILQNYNVNIQQYQNNASSVTNMNISNNLISRIYTPPGNTYSGNISNNIWVYDATQPTLDGGATTMSINTSIELGAGAYLLQNNIFISFTNIAAGSNYNYFTFSNGGNSVFNYNLALESSTPINWGVGTGNIITPIANASNIFAAFPLIGTTSADARYQLKAGSPALTIGAGSTAIGMFTGNYPYALSTIPTIPTVYSLTSPQGNNPPGSTIQINVSTRGNN